LSSLQGRFPASVDHVRNRLRGHGRRRWARRERRGEPLRERPPRGLVSPGAPRRLEHPGPRALRGPPPRRPRPPVGRARRPPIARRDTGARVLLRRADRSRRAVRRAGFIDRASRPDRWALGCLRLAPTDKQSWRRACSLLPAVAANRRLSRFAISSLTYRPPPAAG